MLGNELENIQAHVLIVDDNKEIHEDFKSILLENQFQRKSDLELDDLLSDVFDTETPQMSSLDITIDSAYQGEEALQKVIQSEAKNHPYNVIFMDVRMPPGWDGIETVHKIWEHFPHIEVVICTAYSDFSWHDVQQQLGISHRLLILKKPFDAMEVKQLVLSLTMKSTYYKKYENHVEELERAVEQRTSELKNAKINAELANKAKSTFLSNMSHELRTPLNGILGYTELLSRDNLRMEQMIKIDTIQRCGNHLLDLINNILDLSKIESGQMEKKFSLFNLHEAINDIAQMLKPKFQRKQLYLHIEQDDNIQPIVTSDEKKLRQILINLIGNAVNFTQQGGVTLKIVLEQKQPQKILFSVIDTGQGISKQDLKNIFKPFKQASSNKEDTGTGLGLAISKKFIEILGGELAVESKESVGSRFFFSLEMIAHSDQINLNKKPQKVIGIKKEIKPRILIVSDASESLGALSGILAKVGFDVIQTTNVTEALAKLTQIEIQLIISDVRMKPISGQIFLQKLKEQFPEKMIIMSSASVLDEAEKAMLNAGANGFIAKPIEWSKLFELIASLLKIEYLYLQEEKKPQIKLTDIEIKKEYLSLNQKQRNLFKKDLENGNLKEIRKSVSNLPSTPKGKYLKQHIIKLAMAYDIAGLKALFDDNE